MSYFNYLRTFVTVCRCGSHNKASKILNLSQPAISKHISILEQKLGKELFHRSGKNRHTPTNAATLLAKELMLHIDRIEEIFCASFPDTNDINGSVSIGGLSEFVEVYFTSIIASLIPHEVHFVLQTANYMDWTQMLESHALDLAIIPMPVNSELVGYCELLHDELVIAAHPSLVDGNRGLEEVILLPYLACNQYLHCIDKFFANLAIDPVTLKRSVSVDNFRIIKALLLEGAGFSVIPKSFIQHELDTKKLNRISNQRHAPRMRLYLAWNKFNIRQPRVSYVKEAIIEEVNRNQPKV